MQTNDYFLKAEKFDRLVSEQFDFLVTQYSLIRKKLRIKNKEIPREYCAIIRYEGRRLRLEIAWGIYENSIQIIFCRKPETGICKDYVYFEPFIEYLTAKRNQPIIPQVYPGMSVAKLMKVADERENLFLTPIEEIIAKLAQKCKNYIDEISCIKDEQVKEFQDWFRVHR